MTRQEYLERASKLLNNEFVKQINFPRLLGSMAEYFFLYGEEKDLELAQETRRRLLQLAELGHTDY